MLNIAIIGGGSVNWALRFVHQLISSNYLQDMNVTLMDIDPDALDMVFAAAEIHNRNHGGKLHLKKTTDYDRAIDGADYVVVAISTGRLATMTHDVTIPEQYGIYHTVGDTVGPGGYNRAIRNIPVFDHFAARMKALCPDAWMINVSNPLPILTAVAPQHGIKCVGMCHAVENQARRFATLAGADKDTPLHYVNTGLDHGGYFTELRYGSVDVLGRLKDMGFCRNDDQLPADVVADDLFAQASHNRAVFALWKELGYLSSVADRHVAENFSHFIVKRPAELPFGIKRTTIADRQAIYDKATANIKQFIADDGKNLIEEITVSSDPVGRVIEALEGGDALLWAANIPNEGQIPQAPRGVVVETRCRIDSAGIHPLLSPLPAAIAPIVLGTMWRYKAIPDVAMDGTLDDLAAIVRSDPLCAHLTSGQCRQMMHQMALATADYIPNKAIVNA